MYGVLRKSFQDMKRENKSVYLSAKLDYLDEDLYVTRHTVSGIKMNGIIRWDFLIYTITRKLFAASEYFIKISVGQTIEHTKYQ